MKSPAADIMKPPPVDDVDMEWPLSNYFVNSSHKTCLNGTQLSNAPLTEDTEFSTDAYKDALLRGCRYLEIDICDGDWVPSDEVNDEQEELLTKELTAMQRVWFNALKKTLDKCEAMATDQKFIHDIQQVRESWKTVYKHEPRVQRGPGSTINGFLFSDVCQTIKEHAFAATDLPLIVSLDVHCEPPQQLAVVRIINKAWSEFLLPAPTSDATVLPSPDSLRKKILIKVKQTPPEEDRTQTPDSSTSSLFKKKKTGKAEEQEDDSTPVIEPLSQLGILTRDVPFRSLDQTEAASPTHVFSLSDAALSQTHAQNPAALFRHNRHFLMQTYPSSPRSNPNPLTHWQKGVQAAALQRHVCDPGLMINDAMFAGTGGFVRKPDGVHDPDALRYIPRHRMIQRLAVHVLGAQDLPAPFAVDDDSSRGIRPYATLELHAGPHLYEEMRRGPPASPASAGWTQTRSRSRTHQGLAPDFGGETLDVLNVDGVVPEMAFVLFRVWHEERPQDLPMGWACVRLDRLRCGYRLLRLRDMQGRANKGVVLVRLGA
ncbi:1-phosphatidylinositol 4 5-bisphosphate phosphodiesterase 1 [Apiospora hydei]|uniref:Phosphoinositide phospholipase C n=1 Tax=Apiospora hydei TaxID=1337664 RepID=A0ABR1UUJ0_9PEZI